MGSNIIYTICPRCGYIGLNEDKCKVCDSTMIHTNIPMYNQIYSFDLDVEFEKMYDNYVRKSTIFDKDLFEKAKRINDLGSKTLISVPNIIGKKLHPTEKPIALFEHLIKNSSKENDIILDPFSGSCPLSVACHNIKRNFICIDIDKDFINIGKERYYNKIAQCKLF